MKKLLAALPFVAAAVVLAASGAHAFTFENSSPTSYGSSIVDPDSQIKSSGNASTTSRESGTGLHFSVGPSSGSGLTSRSNPPPGWVGNPLFLDKGPAGQ